MLQKIYFKLILILNLLEINDSARILAVFPTPSISHQVVFRPLTDELAKRGHEVVVITTDPAYSKGKTPANLTEIDMRHSYDIWRNLLLKHVTGNTNKMLTQFGTLFEIMATILEDQLNRPEILKLYNEQKFDLLILEAWFRPILIFSHLFNVPVIQISSAGRVMSTDEDVGAPIHPLFYPSIRRQRLYNLTLWEKVVETYTNLKITRILKSYENVQNAMIQRNFPNAPQLDELANNIDLLMLNIHPIWEDNHPVPPGVIHIWGIYKAPSKGLPDDLKTYLDSSRHGVIYMSFGTNSKPSNLPPETIRTFIKVFSQLPYDVLWKWDTDELPGKSENIRIGNWFPQTDLLKHPKVKLFITQGGLTSTGEAIDAEVPMIGMPMFVDQWYNVEKYVYHGIGIKILPEAITERRLKQAIENIIRDESYRNNIRKLKKLMNDQSNAALERAVWWTEYLLKHGGARHMRAPAANISWTQYLELDLVLSLIVIFILFLIILVVLVMFLVNCIRRLNGKIKLKSN